jgi:hypothetical protein
MSVTQLYPRAHTKCMFRKCRLPFDQHPHGKCPGTNRAFKWSCDVKTPRASASFSVEQLEWLSELLLRIAAEEPVADLIRSRESGTVARAVFQMSRRARQLRAERHGRPLEAARS